MMTKAAQRREKWLAMGKKAFIVRIGMLEWGFATAFLFTLLNYISNGDYTLQKTGLVLFLLKFAGSLLVFPLAGLLYGWFMWALISKEPRDGITK